MPVKCFSSQMLPTDFRSSIKSNFYMCKTRMASVRANNPA